MPTMQSSSVQSNPMLHPVPDPGVPISPRLAKKWQPTNPLSPLLHSWVLVEYTLSDAMSWLRSNPFMIPKLVQSVPAQFWMLQGQIHHFVLSIHPRASAWGWIRKTKMVHLSWGLSNRAGAHVTSQKVVQAECTRGRYNFSSAISYNEGSENVMSLIMPLVILAS
jgi:hypothetical protein